MFLQKRTAFQESARIVKNAQKFEKRKCLLRNRKVFFIKKRKSFWVSRKAHLFGGMCNVYV
jgi:hypothetical protein